MKKIIFDTETTGLLAAKLAPLYKQPYMTEIYAVKVDEDFNILDTLSELISVPIPISKKITQITGISDDTLKGKPTFEQIWPKIYEFFNDADEMIAHNLAFDKGVIKYQFERIGQSIRFPVKQTCTVQKSMRISGRRQSLKKLHKYLTGKDFEGAHRAKNDVFALVRIYHEMLKRGMCD